MDDNLKIFLAEFEELKGQFVILNDKVSRLVAIAEDQHDYYYITYDGRKLTWHTCLCNVVRLKGYIRDEDYEMFEHDADLNHIDRLLTPQITVNIDQYKRDLVKDWYEDEKLLTDIVFNDEDNK